MALLFTQHQTAPDKLLHAIAVANQSFYTDTLKLTWEVYLPTYRTVAIAIKPLISHVVQPNII